MNKTIYGPGGENIFNLSKLIMEQPHVLIGGTPGSGKSVLLNAFVSDAMIMAKLFYFIDLKGVELDPYKDIPSCAAYCDNPNEVENLIDDVVDQMELRFKKMKRQGLRMSNDNDVYLVIDEYVDIKLNTPNPKRIEDKLMRIVSKGRAARIHVILCTQRCTSDILSRGIKANFTSKIGLRCVDRQESRNIIGESGCEYLPIYGRCLVRVPSSADLQKWVVEPYSNEELQRRINRFVSYNKEMNGKEKKGILRLIFG